MARHYYCSTCGIELILKRKALKNKQIIIDLFDPHFCDEEHKCIANITDDEKPTSIREKSIQNDSLRLPSMPDDTIFSDQRAIQFQRQSSKSATSSAPPNLLNQLKSSIPSSPDHLISPIEDEEA